VVEAADGRALLGVGLFFLFFVHRLEIRPHLPYFPILFRVSNNRIDKSPHLYRWRVVP
jgi:hypothetical protein